MVVYLIACLSGVKLMYESAFTYSLCFQDFIATQWHIYYNIYYRKKMDYS